MFNCPRASRSFWGAFTAVRYFFRRAGAEFFFASGFFAVFALAFVFGFVFGFDERFGGFPFDEPLGGFPFDEPFGSMMSTVGPTGLFAGLARAFASCSAMALP